MPHRPGHIKKKRKLTEDELRAQRKSAPDVDIIEERQGVSAKRFGVRAPSERVLQSGNITIAPTQAELRAGPQFIPTGERQFGKKLVTPRNILSEGGLSGISEEEFARIQAQPLSLRSQLQQDILNPLDLKPEAGKSSVERFAERGQTNDFIKRLVKGDVGQAELKEEAKNFAQGVAITGGIAATLGLGIPAIATFVASSSITTSVIGTGGSVPVLTKAVGGLAVFFGAQRVFDIEGGEINQYRQSLKKVVEDGERIEAAVRNGMPINQALQLLGEMEQEVSFAEDQIKELGIFNIEYRVSKEYLLDQQNARSAREALLRRVLAIQNIAATGTAAVSPEALMFDVSQF